MLTVVDIKVDPEECTIQNHQANCRLCFRFRRQRSTEIGSDVARPECCLMPQCPLSSHVLKAVLVLSSGKHLTTCMHHDHLRVLIEVTHAPGVDKVEELLHCIWCGLQVISIGCRCGNSHVKTQRCQAKLAYVMAAMVQPANKNTGCISTDDNSRTHRIIEQVWPLTTKIY